MSYDNTQTLKSKNITRIRNTDLRTLNLNNRKKPLVNIIPELLIRITFQQIYVNNSIKQFTNIILYYGVLNDNSKFILGILRKSLFTLNLKLEEPFTNIIISTGPSTTAAISGKKHGFNFASTAAPQTSRTN